MCQGSIFFSFSLTLSTKLIKTEIKMNTNYSDIFKKLTKIMKMTDKKTKVN